VVVVVVAETVVVETVVKDEVLEVVHVLHSNGHESCTSLPYQMLVQSASVCKAHSALSSLPLHVAVVVVMEVLV
jgi:hypothetical protein